MSKVLFITDDDGNAFYSSFPKCSDVSTWKVEFSGEGNQFWLVGFPNVTNTSHGT